MNFKKILAAACSAVIMGCSLCPAITAQENTTMRDITTMELVHDMGIGINLGNTFESCGDWIAQWGDGSPESYETAWGSPVITQEMIQGYADEGFGVIRIPVAWSNLMGDDYTISAAYLAKVRQSVDWALDAGLYVIMNVHYDNGWFAGFSTDKDTCMYKYTRIWNQLCDAFKDYSDYLMFESLNEEGCWEDIWNRYSGTNGSEKERAFGLLNEINQKFVDIVRSSGGNNEKRHLLIAGYGTDIDLTCDSLYKMPQDSQNRCAVSVHYYTPSTFCILENDADWGKAQSTWGSDSDFEQLYHYMDMLKTTFIDNGVPVIIGEYGATKTNKEEESVRLFISSVCKEATSRQLCPVLWDTTGLHYDRSTCKLVDPQLREDLAPYLIDTPVGFKEGDIDGDGSATVADIVLLQKYLVKSGELSDAEAQRANINNDDVLNVYDLILLKRIVIYQQL